MAHKLVEDIDGMILPTPEMAELLHKMQLRRFGGGDGTRDRSLLASAISRGHAILSFSENPDLIEAACAMGEGIIRNHPFVDGNKRTGFALITTTLHANGYLFEMDPIKAAQAFVDFAAGRMSSEDLRGTIRAHSRLDQTSAEIERLSDLERVVDPFSETDGLDEPSRS